VAPCCCVALLSNPALRIDASPQPRNPVAQSRGAPLSRGRALRIVHRFVVCKIENFRRIRSNLTVTVVGQINVTRLDFVNQVPEQKRLRARTGRVGLGQISIHLALMLGRREMSRLKTMTALVACVRSQQLERWISSGWWT
jgi:hypothetical protein